MEALRAEADGVLIGAGTLRAEDPPLIIRDPEVRDRRSPPKVHPTRGTSRSARSCPTTSPMMNFFRSPETEKLVFTTERTPPDLREAAGRYARIEVVPLDSSGRVDLVEVLRRLPPLGVPTSSGRRRRAELLDAPCRPDRRDLLTICPFVFGGRTAPTSFDGAGFTREHVRKLALKGHRQSASGEVFLHYDVLPDTPALEASRLFPGGFEMS